MDKHALAQELRRRQIILGLTSQAVLDMISDDDVIDSYITCPDCGTKQVSEQELQVAIYMAHDADSFFDCCDQMAASRTHDAQ